MAQVNDHEIHILQQQLNLKQTLKNYHSTALHVGQVRPKRIEITQTNGIPTLGRARVFIPLDNIVIIINITLQVA